MANPLVSVVIPTYNRYNYLIGSLEACLSIESDCIEIIVQDNTPDNSEIISYLEKKRDKRVQYYHQSEHISMTENCDLGVGHAIGDYVCLLGDDDCVCENILHAASYCKSNGIDACCSPFPGFNWSDMTFEGKSQKEARYSYRVNADGRVTELNSQKELVLSLKHGAGLKPTMPRLYHGLVSKQCLDRIYSKVGTYFPGPSPDMANAVVVCLESKKTIFLRDFLIVSGYGRNSATGEGNRGQHFGRIEDKPWLPKDTIQKWDKNIPKIFSGETIIAQSAVQALSAYGCNGRDYKYPYDYLYATFFWHHREVSRQVLLFYLGTPWRFFQFIKGCLSRAISRGKSPRVAPIYKSDEIGSLIEAKEYTERITSGLEYSLSDV